MQSFDLSMVVSILPVHLPSSDFGSVEDVDALVRTTGSKMSGRVYVIAEVSPCKDNTLQL